MKKQKLHLFTLLKRSMKDVARIAPKEMVVQAVSVLLSSVCAGLNTYTLSRLINVLPEYEDTSGTVAFYIIFLLSLFLFKKLADSLFVNSRVHIETSTLYEMNIELSKKCYQIPLIRYESPAFQDSLNRARDCLRHTRLTDINLSLLNILSELFRVASVLVILASFSLYLLPISIASILPFLVIRIIRGNQFYELRWFQTGKERKKKYLSGLFNNKQSMKEIRLTNTGDYLKRKWEKTKDEVNQEIWSFKKRDILAFMGCDFLRVIGYIASIASVVYLAYKGRLDIGMMSVSILAFSDFQTAAKYFFINIGRIPECAAFTKDFYTFLDQEEEKNGSEPFRRVGEIQVHDVSFTYPNAQKPAINHLSLQIKQGQTVVILGENGSGKTTLATLLLGLFQCDCGQISYDGQDVADIDSDSLFQHISIVSQNFSRYHLSLRENVAMGDISRMEDDERILGILKRVKLDSLVQEIGLDGIMGTEFGGKEASVGQWQKIAIARSLVKDSDMIILDEPTAALDPIMESEILKEFLALSKDKTAVIISHRVGLCKEADQIIVMKNGTAVECGTHSGLLEKKGEYHRLYTAQSKWYS